MKYSKIMFGAALLGLVVVPSLANARRGADDPAGHIRQESKPTSQNDSTSQLPETDDSGHDSMNDLNDDHGSRVEDSSSTLDDDLTDDSSSSDSSDDDDQALAPTPQPAPSNGISSAQAIAIAQSYFPNSTFEDVEREFEHGIEVYKVDFTDDARVDVSVSDGSVTRVRQPDND
jgi:hypothetical protein